MATKTKLTRKAYEQYLNDTDIAHPDYMIIGGKKRYCPYGTALRKYDPIAFNVGYQDWLRKEETKGEMVESHIC